MNNIIILRTLIKEFLLKEVRPFKSDLSTLPLPSGDSGATEEINQYQNNLWEEYVKYLKVNINLISDKESKKLFINSIPQDFVSYESWMFKTPTQFESKKFNNVIELFKYINENEKYNIKLIDFETFKKQQSTTNNDQQKTTTNINTEQKFNLSQSYFEFQASDYIDPSLIPGLLKLSPYGEDLIVKILSGSGIPAKKTGGVFDSFDIQITNLGKFEVKSLTGSGASEEIRAGASSSIPAVKFKDLLIEIIDEILKFHKELPDDSNNEEEKQVRAEFNNKIFELLNTTKGDESSTLTIYDHIKKGNLPNKTIDFVKSLVVSVEKIKSSRMGKDEVGKNNEKLIINDTSVSIKTPQEKYAFYKTINYFNTLGVNIPVNKNDIDYILSSVNPNALAEIIKMHEIVKVPSKSFLSDLTGLFIIKNIKDPDPTILYIHRESLDGKLIYSRITPSGHQNLTIKFKIIKN